MGVAEEEFEQELRFLVAAKLYELGRVSSGRAAEVAEMERVAFLDKLGAYRISVFKLKLCVTEKLSLRGAEGDAAVSQNTAQRIQTEIAALTWFARNDNSGYDTTWVI